MSTTTVTTTVDIVAPPSPSIFTNITVAIDDIAIFTILFPIRIVESSLSYSSNRSHTSFAFLFPSLAINFNFVILTLENAISVAEKNADPATSSTSTII